ncbi:MAG TPA: hypothetical protein VMK53_05950 [Gemmatimonadales bacterium]|nr:hypothetical protein [Gemmatimonadales bacterium]
MRTRSFLALGLLAALGCMAEPTATELDPALLSKGNGGGGGGSTSPTDPTATWLIPNDGGLSLRSDGLYSDGIISTYAHGTCGVTAKIYATEAASNSGDATIGMDAPKRGCGRRVTLVYPDDVSETVRTFGNLRKLQNTTTIITIGDTEKRTLAISPGSYSNNPSRCDRLLFGEGGQGNGVGSDSVLVTRVDARTWRVWSDPDSEKLAWCEKTGELFPMTVDFTIVASTDLPQ